MVAACKSNAVPDFEPGGNDFFRLARKLVRIDLSTCLRVRPNLYAVFASGHSMGLYPRRLLGSLRVLAGAKPSRTKASPVALAACQPCGPRVLDHGSNRRPLASKLLDLKSLHRAPASLRSTNS